MSRTRWSAAAILLLGSITTTRGGGGLTLWDNELKEPGQVTANAEFVQVGVILTNLDKDSITFFLISILVPLPVPQLVTLLHFAVAEVESQGGECVRRPPSSPLKY